MFSTFADTVRYLDEHLPQQLGGRQRVTVIGAETNPDETNRTASPVLSQDGGSA